MYIVSGISASKTCNYIIKAVDKLGNTSDFSKEIAERLAVEGQCSMISIPVTA